MIGRIEDWKDGGMVGRMDEWKDGSNHQLSRINVTLSSYYRVIFIIILLVSYEAEGCERSEAIPNSEGQNSIASALSAAPAAQAGQMLDIPLGDELELRGTKQSVPRNEAYDFVDRIVAKNYVTKINKNTRPYSQGEVAKILRELDKKVKEGALKLSQVEEQRLIKLLLELPPKSAQDKYLFQTQGEKHQFGFDFSVGEGIISRRQEGGEQPPNSTRRRNYTSPTKPIDWNRSTRLTSSSTGKSSSKLKPLMA